MTSIERDKLLRLLDRIEHQQHSIMVRANINGVWGNYALSDLPTPIALQYVLQWIRNFCANYALPDLPTPIALQYALQLIRKEVQPNAYRPGDVDNE